MAGETAHFGLRNWPPAPATRPFQLTPRQRSMLDQARAGLAEPFSGVICPVPGTQERSPLATSHASTAPLVDIHGTDKPPPGFHRWPKSCSGSQGWVVTSPQNTIDNLGPPSSGVVF
jgi:hypothetical protein